MQVRCLSERSRVQFPGYNELALNCMDVLTAVIGAVCDVALLRGMLSTLCAALRPGARPPLRLRLAAARLIARSFAQHASMAPDIYGALPHVHVTPRRCKGCYDIGVPYTVFFSVRLLPLCELL